MKKKDLLFIGAIILLLLPFALSPQLLEAYISFNKAHGLITSFIKFGLLATLGEIIGLRIRTGVYFSKTFGILPKAIVWGFLGLTIKFAFVVFATGTPVFMEYAGFKNATSYIKGDLVFNKVLVAFAISTAMNIIYAPGMMLFHKLTDSHIAKYNGRTISLFKRMDFASLLKGIDWNVQWNFVFKKTIPLFWIPAHTITFLLQPEYQVLFAALLSIALGLILAIASLKSEN